MYLKILLLVIITLLYLFFIYSSLYKKEDPLLYKKNIVKSSPFQSLYQNQISTPSQSISFSDNENIQVPSLPFKIGLLHTPQPYTNCCNDVIKPDSINKVNYNSNFLFCDHCLWYNESP